MASLVWLNIPLAILVIAAIVGIPLWMTLKRPEKHPDYAEARAHFRTKEARAGARPSRSAGMCWLAQSVPGCARARFRPSLAAGTRAFRAPPGATLRGRAAHPCISLTAIRPQN
jgi:hypothetical protein